MVGVCVFTEGALVMAPFHTTGMSQEEREREREGPLVHDHIPSPAANFRRDKAGCKQVSSSAVWEPLGFNGQTVSCDRSGGLF